MIQKHPQLSWLPVAACTVLELSFWLLFLELLCGLILYFLAVLDALHLWGLVWEHKCKHWPFGGSEKNRILWITNRRIKKVKGKSADWVKNESLLKQKINMNNGKIPEAIFMSDHLLCSHLLFHWKPLIISALPWFMITTEADSSKWVCLCVWISVRGGWGWQADRYGQRNFSGCGSCPSASNPVKLWVVWTGSSFSPTRYVTLEWRPNSDINIATPTGEDGEREAIGHLSQFI